MRAENPKDLTRISAYATDHAAYHGKWNNRRKRAYVIVISEQVKRLDGKLVAVESTSNATLSRDILNIESADNLLNRAGRILPRQTGPITSIFTGLKESWGEQRERNGVRTYGVRT